MAEEEEDTSVNNFIQELAEGEDEDKEEKSQEEDAEDDEEDIIDDTRRLEVDNTKQKTRATLEGEVFTVAGITSPAPAIAEDFASPISHVSGSSFGSTASVLTDRLDKVEGMIQKLLDTKETMQTGAEGRTVEDESAGQVEALLEQIRILTHQHQHIQQERSERFGLEDRDDVEALDVPRKVASVKASERTSEENTAREQTKEKKRKRLGWWKRMFCCMGKAGTTNAVVMQEEMVQAEENRIEIQSEGEENVKAVENEQEIYIEAREDEEATKDDATDQGNEVGETPDVDEDRFHSIVERGEKGEDEALGDSSRAIEEDESMSNGTSEDIDDVKIEIDEDENVKKIDIVK